jgi:hypothetical protein
MISARVLGLCLIPLSFALSLNAQPREEVLEGAHLLTAAGISHRILSSENGTAYLVFKSNSRLYIYDGMTGSEVCSKTASDLNRIEAVLKKSYGELKETPESAPTDSHKPLNGCYIISLAAAKGLAATPGVSNVTLLSYFGAKSRLVGGVRAGHTVVVYQRDGRVFVQDPSRDDPYSFGLNVWPRRKGGDMSRLATEIVKYRTEHGIDRSKRTVKKTISEPISGGL